MSSGSWEERALDRQRKRIDDELQRALGRDALEGLDEMLMLPPRGETVRAEGIGALVRLIRQAVYCGQEPGEAAADG